MKPGAPAPLSLPWWMSPPGIALGFLVPMLFLIIYAGASDLPGLTVRGLNFMTSEVLALAVALLLVMAIAGWVGATLWPPDANPAPETSQAAWDAAAIVIGLIALLAYGIWFRDFVLNPSLLLSTLTGAFRPDRDFIELTPGITSLANFSPAFLSVYAYRLLHRSTAPMRWPMHTVCALLLLFTLFRVYAWSERLALIEAIVSFGLVGGAAAYARGGSKIRLMVWLGPFAAMPALIFYFGLAESVRSWASPTYGGKMDFWDFAIGRMASYYYTSLNNGAGLLATNDWPTYRFEHVLFWLHHAPLSVGQRFSEMVNVSDHYYEPNLFLAKYADVEFNNPSGLYAVICDLGLPGGFAYFIVLALCAGFACQAYRRGSLLGVLLYPMFFLSFLEVFRYPYFGTPRAFTWVLGIVMLWGIASLLGSPRRYTVGSTP
jgi:hypothetical protein